MYALQPGFSFYQISGTHGYLAGETEQFSIAGEAFIAVLSRVDGVTSDEQIAKELEGHISQAEVFYAFLRLANYGYIISADECRHPDLNPWWHQFDCVRSRIETFKNTYSFSVFATEDGYATAMNALLKKLGLDSNRGDKQQIAIVLCNDYLQPETTAFIRQLESDNLNYFPVRLSGKTLWCGPFLGANGLPCWSCLAHGLRRNRPVETYIKTMQLNRTNHQQEPDLSRDSLETFCNLSLANVIATILQPESRPREPAIHTFSPSSLKGSRHRVWKRANCPECGDPDLLKKQMLATIELENNPNKYRRDGGYRNYTPLETWERYKHLVDSVSGVVCTIEPFKPKDHPLRPVWHTSYYAHPRTREINRDERFIRKSFGKGQTREQARVSALCEALERHSCMLQGDEPTIRGCFSDLKHRNALDPRLLLNFSNRQYETRHSYQHEDKTQTVPRPFDDSREIDWTYAWSLISENHCLLPLTYCFSEVPDAAAGEMCPFNPNGHAAGNTLEEAILQAFLELVERDAVGIWWYNRIQRPEIDLESFADPYFINIKEHYLSLGWQVWALDLTTDLQIPSVIAVARHTNTKDYYIGMGSHLDFHLAVQRAITELHQIFDHSGTQPALWNEQDIESGLFLSPKGHGETVSKDSYGTPKNRLISDDIKFCMETVKRIDSDFIVLNHTRPDIGLATVKVVVPGLRHFWRRLGPGRLYDVPVKMGWLETPCKEEQLNPLALKV